MDKKRKWVVGGASAGAVLVAGLGVGLWAWANPTPPDPAVGGAEYVASAEFGRLSDPQKRDYMRGLRESGQRDWGNFREMDDQQRRQMRENMRPMMQGFMQERALAYIAMSPEERTAFLDQMLDRMDQWGGRGGFGFGGRGGAGGGEARGRDAGREGGDRPRRGMTPERLKNRIENTSPEVRAAMSQIREDLRKRRQERSR